MARAARRGRSGTVRSGGTAADHGSERRSIGRRVKRFFENQEEEIETALDQTEATSEQLPSNNGQSVEKELSLKEKFEKAFSKESITIKY